MSVEYDVIIFGATPAGIGAAIAAATLKARVALIPQGISASVAPELIPHQALLHLAHVNEQLHRLDTLPLWNTSAPMLQWESIGRWLAAIAHQLETIRSGMGLAYEGVDVIAGMGEFCRKPAPGVVVGDRFLQARGYLLAMGSHTRIPAIAGLAESFYLTPETLVHKLEDLRQVEKIAILGSGKTAMELAQALARLGRQIIILTEHRWLLPTADLEVTQWAQAGLEAEGVQIWQQTSIEQVRSRNGKKQLLFGQEILEVDEIIVAAGHSPNLASLNLDAMGVKWSDRGIQRNEKLQTTNARIYACEGRMGNECFTQVANQEAMIALQSILFFPRPKMNYRAIPLAVHISPELAWVGLTEAQAFQQFGKRKIFVLRRSFNTLAKAQIRDDLTGFCKLIVHRDGTLLGAQLVGDSVSESIGVLALAIQHGLKIGAIADLALPSPTLAEILQHTAAEFRRLQLKRTPWQQDLIDNFFDLRRAWSRNPHN